MTTATAVKMVRRNMQNHGIRAAIYDVVIRSINKCVYLKNLECVVIEQVDPAALALSAHLSFVRLDRERLSFFGQVKENELPEQFVREALAEGSECYAVLDGNTLASYGWYARLPTLVNRDLRLHFDQRYIYMYKGFTSPAYRGQRLHAIGMMLALKEYRNQGYKGLVSYVESNNYDSLKSCYRMGYKACGHLRVLRLAGKYFIHNGHGCADYGLQLRTQVLAGKPSSKVAWRS